MRNIKPKVSIVITAYKDVIKLNRCLEAICKDPYENKEIILVSYGINPEEIDANLRSCIYKHIILKHDKGYVYQKNIGFRNMDHYSKYVMFIDDDIEIRPNTITTLVFILEKFNDIGLAQPLLITKDHRVDSIGAYIDYLGHSYMPLRGIKLSEIKLKGSLYKVSYVASCVILRTNLFRYSPFQPYDDFFFFNYEDVDLALRTWLKGYKVVCVPLAIAVHKRGRTSSLKNVPARFVYLNVRNRLITLTSIYDLLSIVKYIPLLILFELIKAIILLKNYPSHSIASLHALTWFMKNLRYVIRRRHILKFLRKRKEILNMIMIKPHFPTLIQEFKRHYK